MKKEGVASDLWITAAFMLYALINVVSLMRHGVHMTQEDGYYYFKIAQQVASGAGSTFDGLHPTNGYHPLWLLCLVPIFRLTRNPEHALMSAILLQGVFLALSVGLMYGTARLHVGRWAACLAALLWFQCIFASALSGLEFSLHALGITASAYLYLRWFSPPLFLGSGADRPTKIDGMNSFAAGLRPSVRLRGHDACRRWFSPPLFLGEGPGVGASTALGLALGLTFLARLETLLLAFVVGLFLFVRMRQAGWKAENAGRLLAFGLPTLILGALYAAVNLRLFGHLLPISGVIKRDWSAYLLAHDPIYVSHGWLAAKTAQFCWPLHDIRTQFPILVGALIVPALMGFGAIVGPRAKEPSDLRRQFAAYSPFALYAALQFIVTALLYHGDLSSKPWYYTVQPWLTALTAGALFQTALNVLGGKRIAVAVLLLVWLAVPLRTAREIVRLQQQARTGYGDEPLYEAALWARANLPRDAVIGAWNAGNIGYFSGRRVVDLDGLVNSWDFYENARHDLCRYWRQTGITYLVDVFENGQAAARVPTYASYAGCAPHLELLWTEKREGGSWRVEAYRIR